MKKIINILSALTVLIFVNASSAIAQNCNNQNQGKLFTFTSSVYSYNSCANRQDSVKCGAKVKLSWTQDNDIDQDFLFGGQFGPLTGGGVNVTGYNNNAGTFGSIWTDSLFATTTFRLDAIDNYNDCSNHCNNRRYCNHQHQAITYSKTITVKVAQCPLTCPTASQVLGQTANGTYTVSLTLASCDIISTTPIVYTVTAGQPFLRAGLAQGKYLVTILPVGSTSACQIGAIVYGVYACD